MSEQEFNTRIIALKPSLSNFAKKLTKDSFRADDLVQDTYVSALRFKHTFVKGELSSWMFTIMKNNFINVYRAEKRDKRKNIIPIADLWVMDVVEKNTPESILYYEDLKSKVGKYLKFVRPKQRIAMQLCLDGYKYEEIAKILSIDLGTVKSRIFFARKELMKYISKN